MYNYSPKYSSVQKKSNKRCQFRHDPKHLHNNFCQVLYTGTICYCLHTGDTYHSMNRELVHKFIHLEVLLNNQILKIGSTYNCTQYLFHSLGGAM